LWQAHCIDESRDDASARAGHGKVNVVKLDAKIAARLAALFNEAYTCDQQATDACVGYRGMLHHEREAADELRSAYIIRRDMAVEALHDEFGVSVIGFEGIIEARDRLAATRKPPRKVAKVNKRKAA
jgi:hypothetical protein